MFITFEGIDGSGKSTLSKRLTEDLGFLWTKEPTFTSEKADALNLGSKNDIEREVEFAVDRIRHMSEILRSYDNVICDRYIWSGLAYCSMYNPSAYPFAEALYGHEFFLKPDVYVFVDTPVEVCYERRKVQPIDQLTKIKDAYDKTRSIVEAKSKIITTQGTGDIEECVKKIKTDLKSTIILMAMEAFAIKE
jgi:dTMP kinase